MGAIAALSTIFGVICCFWGFRIFKVMLGIIGFIIGAYFGAHLGAYFTGGFGFVAILLGLLGGIVGSSLVVALYFLGIFVLGAMGGWILGMMITGATGAGISILIIAAIALAGGLLAVFAQKLILIVATSFVGAWYVVSGAFYFMGSGFDPMAVFRDPSDMIKYSGGPYNVILASWLLLGIAGMFFQYRSYRSRGKPEVE